MQLINLTQMNAQNSTRSKSCLAYCIYTKQQQYIEYTNNDTKHEERKSSEVTETATKSWLQNPSPSYGLQNQPPSCTYKTHQVTT